MPGSLGRRIVSNSGWNFAGHGVGLAAAVVAIPVLIRNLGPETFGIFSIYLALVGYFGLLDLGIGRAVTTEVASHDTRNDATGLVDSVATAVAMLGAIGTVGAGLIVLFREQILGLLLSNSPSMGEDGQSSLTVLAITIPLVLLTSGLRGALEGLRQFKVVSQITMPIGALMFAAPAFMSVSSPRLTSLMWVVFAVRLAGLVLYLHICRRRIVGFDLRHGNLRQARTLLRAGGWMTVSNVVSPLMTSLDRVVVGAQVSMAAVAHYVTAYEMATRVTAVASSIGSAAFPEFVRQAADKTPNDVRRRQFLRASALACLVGLIPASMIFLFAREILSVWISPAFATESHLILRILLVGVVINGATSIPFAFIQGIGRADMTAKFHLLELVLYLPTLLTLLSIFGVLGAAMAWVARVALDAALMFTYSLRTLR